MVLVDTSVWVAHLKSGHKTLQKLLLDDGVCCHPFIIGELACGQLTARAEVLTLLNQLPMVKPASHEEVLALIEQRKLMGKGVGYIDLHLLASSLLGHVRLWTKDQSLNKISADFDLDFSS